MMKLKNKIARMMFLLITGILPWFSGSLKAQDNQFSMYGEVPLNLNPALTAVAYDVRINTNFRNQWSGFGNPYKTIGFSAECGIKYRKLSKFYLSAGVIAFKDQGGFSKMGSTQLSGIINGVLKMNQKNSLSLGILGGYKSFSVTSAGLTWDSQYDGYRFIADLPTGEPIDIGNYNTFDLGTGINWHYSNSNAYISAAHGMRFDVGYANYHLNMAKNSFIKNNSETIYQKHNIYAQASFGLKNYKLCLQPSIFYSMQGPSRIIQPGFFVKYIISEQSLYTGNIKPFAISGGLYSRVKDAIIPAVVVEYDKYAISFCYDLTRSAAKTASKNGLEISFRFNWNPAYGKLLGGTYLHKTGNQQ